MISARYAVFYTLSADRVPGHRQASVPAFTRIYQHFFPLTSMKHFSIPTKSGQLRIEPHGSVYKQASNNGVKFGARKKYSVCNDSLKFWLAVQLNKQYEKIDQPNVWFVRLDSEYSSQGLNYDERNAEFAELRKDIIQLTYPRTTTGSLHVPWSSPFLQITGHNLSDHWAGAKNVYFAVAKFRLLKSDSVYIDLVLCISWAIHSMGGHAAK